MLSVQENVTCGYAVHFANHLFRRSMRKLQTRNNKVFLSYDQLKLATGVTAALGAQITILHALFLVIHRLQNIDAETEKKDRIVSPFYSNVLTTTGRQKRTCYTSVGVTKIKYFVSL